MQEKIEFEIEGEYIELIKFLKFAGMVESGGEAKMVVSEGLVFVNDEQEFRKRKKLYPNDKIEFEDQIVFIKSE